MRIFIYEFASGGGLAGQPVPASLRTEGQAMLAAVLDDFQRLPAAQVCTILDDSPESRAYLSPVASLAIATRRVKAGEEEPVFREAARLADFTLVIAPECDGILARRRRWVDEVGGRWLGCSLPAIELCADKLTLGQHLTERGIPTPASLSYAPGKPLPTFPLPWVWKPRHGAGSQATFLVHHPDEMCVCVDQASREGWTGEALLQPFVRGKPASIAFLIGSRQTLPLLPASQDLSEDGRFRYGGGRIPLPPLLAKRALRLAELAVAVVPGLCGYVGVDVVLGDSSDGRGDCVIEINPRLTTSYVGLRVVSRTNLAAAMLAVACGEGNGELVWQSGPVRFLADGTILHQTPAKLLAWTAVPAESPEPTTPVPTAAARF